MTRRRYLGSALAKSFVCRIWVYFVSLLLLRSGEVEAVKVHYLVPRRYKVVQELLLGVLTSVDFRQGSELGVRTEDEVDTGTGPLEFARCAIRPSNTSSSSEIAFHVVLMSSRFTKKSLVSVSGRLVKTPCWAVRSWHSRHACRQ